MSFKSYDIFLDRNDIFKSIDKTLEDFQANPIFRRIITVWGMGGIGKTSFMNKLIERYSGGYWMPVLFSLEIRKGKSLIDILQDLRNTIPFPSKKILRFDVALIQYVVYMEGAKRNLYSSLLQDTLADTISLVLLCDIPSAVHLNIRLIQEAAAKLRASKKYLDEKDFASLERAIEDGHEISIYKILLAFLAKDFSDIQVNSTSSFLLLFDAYDQNVRTNEYDWLKDFLQHFKHGVFVVSSREYLTWKELSDDKDEKNDFHMDVIPKKYVHEELEKKELLTESINRIIRVTECIPIYLSLVLQEIECIEDTENIFPQIEDKAEIIDRFISHFSEDESNIVKYISVIEIFSTSVADHIQDYLSMSFKKSFSDISQLSLFRYVESEDNIYRLHSVLAKNIVNLLSEYQQTNILNDYLKFVSQRMLYDNAIPISEKTITITNIFNKFYSHHIDIDNIKGELLLKCYFFLVDNGKEDALFLSIADYNKDMMTCGFKAVIKYIEARIERKKDIKKGLQLMCDILHNKPPFGKYIKAIQCDINYLIAISGGYDIADENMKKFVNNLDDRDISERYFRKGYIYYYDMQMLKGRLKTAIKGFLELEQKCEGSDFDLYEAQKAVGHCYRFCFLFDEAITQYKKYKKNSSDELYGLTTLCETLCYVQPTNVQKIYAEAKKLNINAHNHNNLGKIAYAYALAKIFDKGANKKEINELIEESHNEFDKTGYLAGHIFTWQAECFIAYSQNDEKRIKTLAKKMTDRIDQLGQVYGYLMLPVYRMMNDYKQVAIIQSLYEWPDFLKTLNEVDSYLKCLQNR